MKNILIASTSRIFEGDYLDYLLPELESHFDACKTILFIPFARPSGISYEEYTAFVAVAFNKIGKEIKGIHEFENYPKALNEAKGIFVGGGNTFLLVSQLYKCKIIDVLATVVKQGTPYFGTSAGANICGISMQTTNDMPIVYPPSFETLGLIPFNLNPHFLDLDPGSKHMGESRETRINEFHSFNNTPVLGLREGSWLAVNGDNIILKGNLSARLFIQNQIPIEIVPESNLNLMV